ncbi:hypothetical protein HDZ31DRAFT_68871 [Schizophyllum fasciatum]
MTQFLTDVQEMPESVRKKLDSLTRDFIWAGKAVSPVSMEYLNKAIGVMWLKDYLRFGPDRLTQHTAAGQESKNKLVPTDMEKPRKKGSL